MKYIKALLNWRMLVVFLLGFSSGLPLLLIGGTLKTWFARAEMDLTLIGLFSLVGLPYSFKFLWAPFLDRYIPPFLGRRRGWLVISQIAIGAALFAIASGDPKVAPMFMAATALAIAFFSATQDIVIDAYRREFLNEAEFGFGNSLYVTGYRIAMLVSNAGALFLADIMPWSGVYMLMAALMGVGLLTTLFAPEPKVEATPPQSLGVAFFGPLKDYFSRPGAWWILAFILLYKLGDNMASEMTAPFYVQMGYTNSEIAGVVKVFGIWSTIVGGLIGGALMVRIGIVRALWLFGIFQGLSTAGFAWLVHVEHNLTNLAIVVSIENLTAGMGIAALVSFMASITNKKFTATQYALLTSLMSIPRTLASAPTGFMAKHLGWAEFFIVCTLIAVPGMLVLLKVQKYYEDTSTELAGAS
ncbi:MAG TPA: AmpG family muropeptide MFS transporter [Bdellovibrionales bacterium]|jgi:PAT family beta-lactamase induction signal transducer AmpG|nr:AmpG family muropeptide MFS transporter [Bdellovibrionales bacterium]